MPFEIVRNDVTKMSVDAIVNTANPRPVMGLGTDSMIHEAAGPGLLIARQAIGRIDVGSAIHHIGNVHKYAREEDRPEKTLVVITTDGMENASRKYSYEKLKTMIERQKEKYGWEFIFLGANIDAVKEAARFDIDANRI